MKRITWEIGVQKLSGNTICDSILHYNEPKIIILDGTNLRPNEDYVYNPNNDGVDYSDIYGYLDFTAIGGLVNTQKIQLIW